MVFGAKHSFTPRHLRETHRRMVGNGIVFRGDLKLLMNLEKKLIKKFAKFLVEKNLQSLKNPGNFRFFEKIEILKIDEKSKISIFQNLDFSKNRKIPDFFKL